MEIKNNYDVVGNYVKALSGTATLPYHAGDIYKDALTTLDVIDNSIDAYADFEKYAKKLEAQLSEDAAGLHKANELFRKFDERIGEAFAEGIEIDYEKGAK